VATRLGVFETRRSLDSREDYDATSTLTVQLVHYLISEAMGKQVRHGGDGEMDVSPSSMPSQAK
jgi:hypothetical protein